MYPPSVCYRAYDSSQEDASELIPAPQASAGTDARRRLLTLQLFLPNRAAFLLASLYHSACNCSRFAVNLPRMFAKNRQRRYSPALRADKGRVESVVCEF